MTETKGAARNSLKGTMSAEEMDAIINKPPQASAEVEQAAILSPEATTPAFSSDENPRARLAEGSGGLSLDISWDSLQVICDALTLAKITVSAQVASHQQSISMLNPQPLSERHTAAIAMLAGLNTVHSSLAAIMDEAQADMGEPA